MGAAKRQMLEDDAHDQVIQELRARLYEMADLFSSFRITEAATSLDLVRGIFRHRDIRHPMTVMVPWGDDLGAAFAAKYPGHEIPLNLTYEDPDHLSTERFVTVANTLHALADMLSWQGGDDEVGDED